jgi:DNA (cytosine-5)-methyltransferase 1
MLILSIFPGIDLLGRGFELEGCCVVRGPDLLWGGNIQSFHPPANRFDGVIGGSPCQDFSAARRNEPTGYGVEMLGEFARVVTEAAPEWFLLENVPRVPDMFIPGYLTQRFDLNAQECGLAQRRARHFQFGSRHGLVVTIRREKFDGESQPICLATEGKRTMRRSWPEFCELQGLPADFQLPGLSLAARYAAVGNGVPVPMARLVAQAIREALARTEAVRVCACNCGRQITGRQHMALPACRKRLQRRRDRAAACCGRGVTKCDLAINVTHREVTVPSQSQSDMFDLA